MFYQTNLKLYGSLVCPYVQRVRFLLEQAKIQYDYQELNLLNKEQHQEWYKLINPSMKVPSIVYDDNKVIFFMFLLKLQYIHSFIHCLFILLMKYIMLFSKHFSQRSLWNLWLSMNFFVRRTSPRLCQAISMSGPTSEDGFAIYPTTSALSFSGFSLN